MPNLYLKKSLYDKVVAAGEEPNDLVEVLVEQWLDEQQGSEEG